MPGIFKVGMEGREQMFDMLKRKRWLNLVNASNGRMQLLQTEKLLLIEALHEEVQIFLGMK